jgi:Leucine-rich repeat (LRR) protein
VIIASGTAIKDLVPIKDHEQITYLDISGTTVQDISMLGGFTKLKTLRADNSKIEKLETLVLPSLKMVYADQTIIHDITAREFLDGNPDCLLVYKTIHLNRWWDGLSDGWKSVFNEQLPDTTRESYHRLVEKKTFHFKDARVSDLGAFTEFIRLKELYFSGTNITTLPNLESFQSLVTLHATNSPVQHIEPGGLPISLQYLDLSNTAINDLRDLGRLPNLKTFNCSGTPIKRLDNLENSGELEHLDCSNTSVRKLSPIEGLPLQSLNCYNTKISGRNMERFIALQPNCKVTYY